MIDVSTFDGAPGKRRRARWDDDTKVLVNSDFAYLNAPVKSGSRNRIVACSIPIGENGLVFYTALEGFVRWIELPRGDVQGLLGSWITVEHELVADAQTFQEWCKTHPFFGGEISFSYDDDLGKVKVLETSTGVTIRYRYTDGRLSHCWISTPQGEIEENVETDSLGRIVAVARDPDDWHKLASSLTSVASPE
jgi:hypothetical protein